MKCFFVICGLVCGMSPVLWGQSADDTQGYNAREFTLLCKFFTLGSRGMAPANESGLRGSVKEILNRITELEENVSKLHRGEGSMKKKIQRRLEKAQKLAKDFNALGVEDLHGQVNTLLKNALYGEKQTDFDAQKSIAGSDYANGCGGVKGGKASGPGSSLANDMLCLCTGTGSQSKTGRTCLKTGDFSKGALSHASEAYAKGTHGADAWTKISHHCLGLNLEITLSPLTIHSLTTKFYGLLGKNLAGSTTNPDNVANTLGRAATSGGCDGSKQDEVCVIYTQQMTGPAADGIPWLNKMNEAAEKLEEIEKLEVKRRDLIQQLRDLNTSAWEIYEEVEENAVAKSSTTPVSARGNLSADSTGVEGRPLTKNGSGELSAAARPSNPIAMSRAIIGTLLIAWSL